MVALPYKQVGHAACSRCGQPFVGIERQRYCGLSCWRAVRKRGPHRLRKWTEAQLTEAYARAQAGIPVRQIAVEANVNQVSIGRLLKRRFGYVPTPYRRPTLTIPNDAAIRAYIAGIIDGEGSIPFLNKHWCVKVGMTDEPVIRWLHSFGGYFGVEFHRSELNKAGAPRKPIYNWEIHRHHDVIHLLNAVLPYLIVKKARADHVLAQIS
jgi:hypothetical protein